MTPELREKVRKVEACGAKCRHLRALDCASYHGCECDECLDKIINALRYYFRKGAWPGDERDGE